jgi:hypothetical protein
MGAKVYPGKVGRESRVAEEGTVKPPFGSSVPQICNLARFFASLFSGLPVNIRSGVLVNFAATGARDPAVMLSHFC